MSGDVMMGRGVDQILPNSVNPVLYESYVKDARHYVKLAEALNGRIARPVPYNYPWGYALLSMKEADVRIINLETSITSSTSYEAKGINYRMHPKNIPCLIVAQIDCCALANNHIMDWGRDGLIETLETLDKVGIRYSGVGRNAHEAATPAIIEVPKKGRVVVFSFGTTSSGISSAWKAKKKRPGVNMLDNLSSAEVDRIRRQVSSIKKPGDIVMASIHWGSNWGYDIPLAHQKFAHQLIDNAFVDVIHGHSSHHVLGIEVYKQKPIIYGCGDLLNDYEGIEGYESFKPRLGFLYFLTVDITSGDLTALRLEPTEVKRFQITRPNKRNVRWLQKLMNSEGEQFGTRVVASEEGTLELVWG